MANALKKYSFDSPSLALHNDLYHLGEETTSNDNSTIPIEEAELAIQDLYREDEELNAFPAVVGLKETPESNLLGSIVTTSEEEDNNTIYILYILEFLFILWLARFREARAKYKSLKDLSLEDTI